MGISTFVIDGFSGRGLTATSTNQALLGRLNFIVDIYRALEILAKHPHVDPDRIVLMGFSRGGQAALYASESRFHKLWNKSGLQFAAYIPFYPDCMTTYVGDTDVVDRPIRIFHGTPDDYDPLANCKAFVARLKEARRKVVLTEYPDSQHGFDAGLLGVNSIVVSANAQTVWHCHIREGEGALLVNADTEQPFSYKGACVEFNPHVGGNPATAEERAQGGGGVSAGAVQAGVARAASSNTSPLQGRRAAPGEGRRSLDRAVPSPELLRNSTSSYRRGANTGAITAHPA
jgi:hypothetical protein